MKILVSKEKLRALLQAKSQFIGYHKLDYGITVGNALFVILSGLSTDAHAVFGYWFNFLEIAFGLWSLYWSGRAMCKAITNNYDANSLEKDINDLNEIEHPFSLVAIRDTFNQYPHRFLLYYDHRWGMHLFPNYKTLPVEEENIRSIKARIANELEIPESYINVVLRGFETYTKYSVSDKQQKCYAHTLYEAEVKEFSAKHKADSFTIGDKHYSWWSIVAMEQYKDIQLHNLDVVEIVKRNMILYSKI